VTEDCGAEKEGVAAPGAVVFRSTDTLNERPLATARSGLPPLLRSATVTEYDLAPVAKSCRAAKEGVAAPGAVVFRSTDTVDEPSLATARSGLPSPLRSPTDTDSGTVPVSKVCWIAKLAGW